MSKIYPNAPLDEVVIEIRFPAELSIESSRDEYYEKIRKELPNIFVPRISTGESLSLLPYSFKNDDGNETVQFSINRISYHTNKYTGYNRFKTKAMHYLPLFCRMYKIKSLKRTGLRYINYIPFERDNNIIPIQKYINFGYDIPSSIPQDYEAFNTELLSKIKDGKMKTSIGIVTSTKNPTIETIALDFDFYFEGELKLTNLGNYLETSHNHIKKVFEDIISDRYRKIMEGEILT